MIKRRYLNEPRPRISAAPLWKKFNKHCSWVSAAAGIYKLMPNLCYGAWYKEISTPCCLRNKTSTNSWVLKFQSRETLETGFMWQFEVYIFYIKLCIPSTHLTLIILSIFPESPQCFVCSYSWNKCRCQISAALV